LGERLVDHRRRRRPHRRRPPHRRRARHLRQNRKQRQEQKLAVKERQRGWRARRPCLRRSDRFGRFALATSRRGAALLFSLYELLLLLLPLSLPGVAVSTFG